MNDDIPMAQYAPTQDHIIPVSHASAGNPDMRNTGNVQTPSHPSNPRDKLSDWDAGGLFDLPLNLNSLKAFICPCITWGETMEAISQGVFYQYSDNPVLCSKLYYFIELYYLLTYFAHLMIGGGAV